MLHYYKNQVIQGTQSVLDFMEKQTAVFYPTGSQVINVYKFRPESDLDFFTNHLTFDIAKFQEFGFENIAIDGSSSEFFSLDGMTEETQVHYRDGSLVGLWQMVCPVSKRLVQIQEIHPDWMDAKLTINHFLVNNPKYLQGVPKHLTKKVWRSLMTFYRTAIQLGTTLPLVKPL